MPPLCRLGDTGSGHGSFPPTNVIGAAGTVIGNGKGAARMGDPLAPHGSPSPSPPHGRNIAGGSGNVIMEGSGAARIGDSIGCGGNMVNGSGNIIIN